MLVGHDVVFVVGVDRLVLGRDIDFFGWKLQTGEVFEEVGVVRLVEVEEGEGGVAGLVWGLAEHCKSRLKSHTMLTDP